MTKGPIAKTLKAVQLRLAPKLPDSVELGGRAVPLVVREHHAARRLIMRLSPGGGLQLTVPRRTSARTILAFLDRHRQWADERIAARPERLRVADGAVIPVRGRPTRIVHEPGRRGHALDEDPGTGAGCLRIGGEARHLTRRLRDALIREARRDLQAAVDRHAAAVGLKPSGLTLKDTRSRWGSCSSERRLSFSWRIVLAPPFVLDYLAAHEVAHFRQMNHGPDFWALCAGLCPGMEEGRDWLKRHGASLHAIDFAAA